MTPELAECYCGPFDGDHRPAQTQYIEHRGVKHLYKLVDIADGPSSTLILCHEQMTDIAILKLSMRRMGEE